jgi:hypothetical protein
MLGAMGLTAFLKRSGKPADAASAPTGFDPSTTTHYQVKMRRAPVWFCSFLAGNHRESRRLGDELARIKGAWPLLMKQRRGGKWTPEEKQQLKAMVRSASSVSPYIVIWALPGSVLLLPFLAWYLDRRRRSQAPGINPRPPSP